MQKHQVEVGGLGALLDFVKVGGNEARDDGRGSLLHILKDGVAKGDSGNRQEFLLSFSSTFEGFEDQLAKGLDVGHLLTSQFK